MRRLVLLLSLPLLVLAACGDDGDSPGGGGGSAPGGSGGGGGGDGGGGPGGGGGEVVDPTITSVTPASGPVGTTVTVAGTGFQAGAELFFGSSRAGGTTVVSSTELQGTAPAREGGGAVDVTVRNADGGSARLTGGFTYDGGQPLRSIGWAALQFPAVHTGVPGSTVDVYGRVFAEGVTEAAGAPEGIEMEVGVGPDGSDPTTWTWAAGAWNLQADNNDEFFGAVTLPEVEGAYRMTVRFRIDGGLWTIGDLDGSTNGFDPGQTGRLTVALPPAPALDHCILQFPPVIEVSPGAPAGTIYVRAYEPGVTDGGDPRQIEVEVGVGVDANNPVDWSWLPATYQRDVNNDDEHALALQAPPVLGTYRYAGRGRIVGSNDWLLCDLDGSANGFDLAQAGTLQVTTPPPATIDWGILTPAAVAYTEGEAPARLLLEVYEPGVTDAAGDGGVQGELYVGGAALPSPDVDPTGWTRLSFAWLEDAPGLGGGVENDRLAAELPVLPAGDYRAYATVTLDRGNTVTWIDVTGTADGFDAAAFASILVRAPAPAAIDWGILREPASLAVLEPGAALPVVIDLYEPGRTPGVGAGAGLVVEIGIGAVGADLATFTFTQAPYAGDVDGGGQLADDRFVIDLPVPAAEGLYELVARARLDGGTAQTFDLTGSDDGFDRAMTGRLQVQAPPPPAVDYCRIQFPPSLTVTAGVASELVFGRVFESAVTEGAGQGGGLVGEVGFGPQGSDPAAGGWVFSPGAYNGDLMNDFGSSLSDDEYRGSMLVPIAGTYSYAWRFSLDGGASWTYCDQGGSGNGYDPNDAGLLTAQ